MKQTRLSALALSFALILALAGCTQAPAEPTQGAVPTATAAPIVTPTPAPEGARQTVNLAVLKGNTGMGSVKLLADNEAGLTANDYQVTIAAAPDEVAGKLVNGDIDIAALPTNLAATLYHKTDGGIQLASICGLGVLYILENGNSVSSIADLQGRTLYATGQGANPEYVINYLLRENGLEPGTDVTIEWKSNDELTALMGSGEIDLCMLPVPAATGVTLKNPDVRFALDLTGEWDQVTEDGTLTMSCVVVRTEFAQEHPDAVNTFLDEFGASIDYVNGNPDEASELVAQYGITPSAAVAKAAIPQVNLIHITGKDLWNIQGYYQVLYAADPASIGGSIPDDAFYYVKESNRE